MKKLLLATTLLAGSVAAAQAADLPSRKAPPPVYTTPAPVMTWTGFYAGLNVGYGWMDNFNKNTVFGTGFANPHGGVLGGGQIGYNWQVSPMFVLGVETDFQGSSVGGGFVPRHTPWFGTLRGRIGVTPFNPNLLLYATGGLAYGDLSIGPDLFGTKYDKVAVGWTVGGGVEYAFSPNWSVKAEYLFKNMGADYPTGLLFTQQTERVHEHLVRVGVNYRFNWGGPAPVVAKY